MSAHPQQALAHAIRFLSIDAIVKAQELQFQREAALQIADPQVRYMGTVGGNVANGDPGNDMPGLMQCLDATFTLVGPSGSRDVAARDFYHSAYVTERSDEEILTRISFAAQTGGYAYEKQKRKIGDYATAACAVQLTKAGVLTEIKQGRGFRRRLLATMNAQQAVAKRSVGRRVTSLTRLFFSFSPALRAFTSLRDVSFR